MGGSWPQALTIGFIKKFNENNKTVNQKDYCRGVWHKRTVCYKSYKDYGKEWVYY